MTALEGKFDLPLSKLPARLKAVVKQVFPLVAWDDLDPEQRRHVAIRWDTDNRPAAADEYRSWWDFYILQDKVRADLLQWESVSVHSALDLARKEERIGELRRQLAEMERRIREADDAPPIIGDRLPADGSIPDGRPEYIAFPKVAALLAERCDATPEEIAAWIWCGPKDGGLRAFQNANEFVEPPRFHFAYWMGPDYLAAMMGCWFRAAEIAAFVPGERFLTGRDLVERWRGIAGVQPEGYIRAKIEESRLLDFHPTMGGTRAGSPEVAELPSLDEALFCLSHVEAIEAEDFPKVAALPAEQSQPVATVPEVGSPEWRSANGKKAAQARHAKTADKRQYAKDEIRRLWASGKYSSRDLCAEEEHDALKVTYSTARKALKGQPEPARKPRQR